MKEHIKALTKRILNFDKLPAAVKQIIKSATIFSVPTMGSEMMLHSDQKLVASATIEKHDGEGNEVFHSLEGVTIISFWVRGEDGKPKNLIKE